MVKYHVESIIRLFLLCIDHCTIMHIYIITHNAMLTVKTMLCFNKEYDKECDNYLHVLRFCCACIAWCKQLDNLWKMSSSCVSNSVTFYVFMKFHYNFYVSVWLDHLKELHQLINNEAQIAGDFLESGKRIFTNASTNSIVDIISMIQIATLQTTFHFSKLISMVYLQDSQRSTLFTDFFHRRLVK